MNLQSNPVRVLFVEDVEDDVTLAMRQLQQAGLSCEALRVETEPDLRHALRNFEPAVIISDFSLPQFDGRTALAVAHEMSPEIPFLFVSGTIGEERAIDALHRGAVDYVLKSSLKRLGPAVRRALGDAAARAEKRQQQAQIARLDRVLHMLSGINGLVIRIRERDELLAESCRLATGVGGYVAAIAILQSAATRALQVATWSACEDHMIQSLISMLKHNNQLGSGILHQAFKSGGDVVCNHIGELERSSPLNRLLIEAGYQSAVVLPLQVDKTAVGVLLLSSLEENAVSEDELRMLREVAGNLSFGLQYLQKDKTVRFLSHFDSKTGLAKRPLFCERVDRILRDPVNRGSRYAIGVIDIEGLSIINDTHGRRVGDLLLQHLADRLKRRFPETEHIAHLSGGTFAVLRDVSDRGAGRIDDLLPALQEHAAALFGEPFVIEEREIQVSARSGIALFPGDGPDANQLVQNAENALRNARAADSRHFRFSADKQNEVVERMNLRRKLQQALQRREFELHYQPKVNVITRRIQGVEALLRWRDRDYGLVSPAAFLPLLESSGLIVDVGRWALQQAAADCQYWLNAGLPPLRVAVNIAPLQLREADFADQVAASLADWSSSRWGLDLEITESALQADSQEEIKKLKYLRTLGVKIAIDDFGTGYSSLNRLAELPIDTLKIDRSFVTRLTTDPAGKVLAKTIISLARAFNLTTVAEGVETQEQLDLLWHMGCDQSQGFLHAEAMASDDLVPLLRNGKGRLLLAVEADLEDSEDLTSLIAGHGASRH